MSESWDRLREVLAKSAPPMIETFNLPDFRDRFEEDLDYPGDDDFETWLPCTDSTCRYRAAYPVHEHPAGLAGTPLPPRGEN